MLAHFAKAKVRKQTRAIDLGCGSGVISIIMAWESPDLFIDGIEIQPDAAKLAAENTQLNELSHRVKIIEDDIRAYRSFSEAGKYDLAVSNPPYYPNGSGKLPKSEEIAVARAEALCNLDDICQAAGYLIKWGGSLMLVHKPERLADIFRSLNDAGFEPKRMRFVQHQHGSPPNLVLIESRRGGNPSLKIEAPLILANGNGSDSNEVKAIYRR